VTPDGVTGFCMLSRAVRGPSVGQLWARPVNGLSFQYLALSWLNVYR